ncbi:MAG TPA: hypothetical protein VN455_13130 [Methanotrichaceae archaeon]|nr:hypothetical protein [Methanotrichaceae archaeon]
MAGVFERLRWPFLGWRSDRASLSKYDRLDIYGSQLQMAKEILGEVFNAAPPEVDEMIRQRLADR